MGVDGGGDVTDGEGGCHGSGDLRNKVGSMCAKDVATEYGSVVAMADEFYKSLRVAHRHGLAIGSIEARLTL